MDPYSAWEQRVQDYIPYPWFLPYPIKIVEGEDTPKLQRFFYPIVEKFITVGKEWLRKNLTEEEFASYVIDRIEGNYVIDRIEGNIEERK